MDVASGEHTSHYQGKVCLAKEVKEVVEMVEMLEVRRRLGT